MSNEETVPRPLLLKQVPLCHCGNVEKDHSTNFKHKFNPCVQLKIDEKEGYVLNALQYPVKTKIKCKHCHNLPFAHKDDFIKHPYEREEIKYREVNYTVPWETVCVICGADFQSHIGKQEDSFNKHTFTIKLKVENMEAQDVLVLNDPEYDDNKILVEK